jgi:hypothetical protein
LNKGVPWALAHRGMVPVAGGAGPRRSVVSGLDPVTTAPPDFEALSDEVLVQAVVTRRRKVVPITAHPRAIPTRSTITD